jgi:hypothetical protein
VQYLVEKASLDFFLALVRVAMCPHIELDIRISEAHWSGGRVRVLIEEKYVEKHNPFNQLCTINRIVIAVRKTGFE